MKSTKILLFSLFTFSFSFAQTEADKVKIIAETNIAELNRIAPIYDSIYKADKRRAMELAAVKGWQEFIAKPNGGIAELVRVDEFENPVYNTTDNAGAAITTRANRLNSGGSLGLQLDGQNMTIGVWDGGKVRSTHQLLTGRVTQVDNPTSVSDHATHVSGTMMGNATASPASKGMASQANLRAYDWTTDTYEVTQAAANALLVSNHSYGSDPVTVPVYKWGKYDADAKAFDNIMYNAPYYLFVNSAGNSRNSGYNSAKNGYDLLSGKSTSKNGIIVAAVNQVSNYTSASSVTMSSFSSWGPTDDGRVKPDICGKGVNVRSCTSTSDSSYSSYSGTSMSSPNVAGTLLLLQQHFKNVKGGFMRSATLRGLAIHTADEAGSATGPDYKFGWGLLNAERAAVLISNDNVDSMIKENTLNQGSSYTFNFEPNDATKAISGTVCWTDPTGTIINNSIEDFFAPALVNDLDFRIAKAGTTNFPWKLNPAQVTAAATKGDNTVDNVEKIEVAAGSGTYTVTISHKGNLMNALQKYSLLLSNIKGKSILLSSNENMTNRVCLGTASSTFNFQLEANPTFSGVAQFSYSGLPAGANANFSSDALTASGSNNIVLTNLETVPAGTYNITVTATAGAVNTNLFYTLIIQSPQVVGPALTTPVNAAAIATNSTTLVWENIGNNVASYTIEVSVDATFSSGVQSYTTTTNQLNLTNLFYGTTYYWRVKAANECGFSEYSTPNSFTTNCSSNLVVSVSNVSISGATFTWTNPNGASSFEVLVVPAGSGSTGTYTTVTSNSYTVEGLNSYSSYDFYVRSSCAAGTFSNVVNKPFNTLINHCVDGVFFDTGGPTGNYSNSEYYTTTMNPINAGDQVSVTFTSFNLENGIDRLTIYNGPSITSPFIVEQYGFTGTNSPGTVTSTDASGKLTFVFYSDGANTAPGFNATVTCANLATTQVTKSKFIYYPNPAQAELYFDAVEPIQTISAYNLLGQLVLHQNVNDRKATINTETLAPGNYLFKVQTTSATETVKINKQ
ncbi:MAG: hypothetical protein RL699_819 [Bacteroidota bacterium]|jgi:hypothetical protein